ncbi:MAG: dUTP diphosphatase [Brevinema sp.]
MNIPVIQGHPQAKLPTYQSADAAGADLYACIEKPMIISSGALAIIPTGLSLAIPKGYEMQIRARSGLASKGLVIPNAPGTIDADYRGEIKVLLLNLSGSDFEITPDMRIAQAVIAPIFQVAYQFTEELSETERGSGGFGSTGTHH